MPGVKITVTSKATGISYPTTTDKEGYFQVLNLPIGDYRVTAEQENFKTLTTDPPPLQINQVLRVDMRMQIGARGEAITVEGLTAGVETVNATLGHSITSRPVVDLPLNGRVALDLALLQPGVTEVNPRATDGGQHGTFGIAGGKSDSVTFLLDGGLNNDLLSNEVVYEPTPDAIAEFRVLTSNYAPEYGRNAGGIVSIVTKSGTNTLHGSAYEFLRNDALDANSYFNKQEGLPRDVLKRNQFGGTLGGPFPHGKDRFFWFFNYSGQRQTQSLTTTKLPVYTPAQLQGDFSGDPNVIAFLQAHPYYQPNATLAAQGIIDPSKISPVAQNYIAAGLVPTSPTGEKIAQAGSKNDSDLLNAKLDFQINPKDKLNATLGWSRNPVLNPFSFAFGSTPADAFGYGSTGDHHRQFLNVSWDRTISATLLNDARFTAQRVNIAQAIPASQLPTAADLGVGITPDDPTGPPRIGFNSGLTLGFSPQGPTTEINNTFAWSDTLSWVKGKHNFKFGGSFSAYQNNTHYDFYVNGEFDFYGSSGSVASGNDFADFLFGIPDEYFQFGGAPSNIRSKSYAGFAQDEWHVRNNLTLTFGLRYEYNSPKRDTQGRSFSVVPGAHSTRFVNAPEGLLFPGDAGAPEGANFPDRNDFAPRFGFAWDPFSNGKTSIRGGFGVFYDILKAEDNLQFNGQAPFFGYVDLFFDPLPGNPSSDPGYMSQPFVVTGQPNPFPSKPPASDLDFGAAGFLPFGGGGVYFVNPHLRTPYTYQYNLSIQHELAQGLTLETSYVGSLTRKNTALVDQNPFILGTTDRVLNTQPGIPDPLSGFSYLLTFENVVNARYDGLQASLTKQLTSNRWFGSSYFTLAYTWGKSIDNASGFRNVTSQVPAYNHNLFRAVSDYDITHRIAFSGGWDLPFDRMWTSGPKRFVKGWSIYPIVTWRTGFPLDIASELHNTRTNPGPSGAGDAAIVRANLTGPVVPRFDPRTPQTFTLTKCGVPQLPATGAFWFDPRLFSTDQFNCDPTFDPVANPSQRTYGTYPRNSLRGPNRGNFDFAIAKKTPIKGERLTTEFRAEFFNLLNHAQFQDPTVNFDDPSFGQVTKTYDPRIIQFGLKVIF
jgi:outer membrane receptor protein involved in Fe transport